MSEKSENDQIKKDKRLVETAFLFLGIGSLLPWNAIISVFDFFIYYQKDQQPDKVFPIINFVFNLSVQIILLCSKNLLSYKNQLFLSQYLSAIGLVLFPLVVTTFVADKMSDILGMSRDEIEGLTTQNAIRFFRI